MPGCPPQTRLPAWDYSFRDITGDPAGQHDALGVDLYLDSTVSMSGFTSGATSSLADLVRDLEGAAQTGWKQVSIRYLKFGTKVAESERSAFITGMSTPAFFRQKGLSATTSIDAVLAQSDPKRLSLIVTDLFQTAGDVNAVVTALKDYVVAKDVAVGILPVQSEFLGTVYDANVPPYEYRSTSGEPSTYRAFYLLMLGDAHDMRRMVDVIGARPFIDRRTFLLLSPFVVKSQAAGIDKGSLSRNVVATTARDLGPNESSLDLREGADATVTLRLAIETVDGAPPLNRERLEMAAFRKTPHGPAPTEDVKQAGAITLDGAMAVRLPLSVHLDQAKGIYEYRIDLRNPTLNAFETPAWVAGLSTTNPSPSFEPNKTLNLAPFVRGLIQAQTSVHQAPVARAFLRIRKR